MSDQKPKTELVIDPRSADFKFAQADLLQARAVYLDDVYEVMRKHNCVLTVKEIVVAGQTLHPLLIAKVEDGSGKARVLCELRQITPEMIESRRLMWTGNIIRDPFLT